MRSLRIGIEGSSSRSQQSFEETTVVGSSIASGGDIRLEGARASGHRVLADIGGDLILTSRQDENTCKRKDQSAGIDVAVGFGGSSVSGNYGQTHGHLFPNPQLLRTTCLLCLTRSMSRAALVGGLVPG